jgi:hypothetical protein
LSPTSPDFLLGLPSAGFTPGASGFSWKPRAQLRERIPGQALPCRREIRSAWWFEGPGMSRLSLPLDAVARRLRDAQLLLETRGPLNITVTGVSQDSRSVAPGDLFLAWKGLEHDAHDFLPQAVSAGAVAAVVERLTQGLEVTQLHVRNGRLGAALAADTVMGSPWEQLFVGGVTGTNGKTTTAVLARHLLQTRDDAVALGTLGLVEKTGGIRPGTEGLTTPGPVQIAGWARELADSGVEALIMEASSHALAQYRLDGFRFDVVAFTNLGHDHLDYHADPADYRAAKARLLELMKPRGWGSSPRPTSGPGMWSCCLAAPGFDCPVERKRRRWISLSWGGSTSRTPLPPPASPGRGG